MGEINLLYETAVSSKVYKVKVFTARISGDSALMTVAKYEDESEESPDLPSMHIFLKFAIEMEIRLGTLFTLEVISFGQMGLFSHGLIQDTLMCGNYSALLPLPAFTL